VSVRITYVTHSTTTDNEAGIATGWNPGALSRVGREQARGLGERYGNTDFDAIYVSDLLRAIETATIAFGEAPLHLDARLRECNYGTRNGTTITYGERLEHITEPFPDGESYADVVERMGALLAEMAVGHDGEHVLLVSHSAPRLALDHLLRGIPLQEAVEAMSEWRPGWSYVLADGFAS
jgi:broad specificity phosphatase PhoE